MKNSLLILLLVATLSATVADAQYVPDFVSPTIDKTVVVTPHNTYTVPGAPGGGTSYVYPIIQPIYAYPAAQPTYAHRQQHQIAEGRFNR